MEVLIATANNGLPYVEVCMSYIHNNNFSVYFTLPVLKKRVLIIYHSLYPLSKSEFLSFVLLLAGCTPSSTVSQRKCIPLSQLYEKGTGIAVWDFEITSPNEDVHMNRFLPNRIRKRINKEGHFNLIDRDHLLLSLQELNLGTNLLTD